MAINGELIKIVPWATHPANRQLPSAIGIERAAGFDQRFEQRGSGFYPDYKVFNQLLHELSVFVSEKVALGIFPWDERVDYRAGATVTTAEGVHLSRHATGPRNGGAVNPAAEGQTAWDTL